MTSPALLTQTCLSVLASAVPARAQRMAVVADDETLANRLCQDQPTRQVFPTSPGQGVDDLPGGLDVIVITDLVAVAKTPRLLTGCRQRLRRGGLLLVLTEHALHYRRLTALWRGLGPPLGAAQVPTAAVVLHQFLDAGFAPYLRQVVTDPCPPELIQAFTAVGTSLGLPPEPMTFLLGAAKLLFEAVPEPEPLSVEVSPLTFVVCVSDEATLQTHLLRSPCLAGDHPHQILRYHDCTSAAEGLNRGLEQAEHELVVCVHQDVYLPVGWPQRLWRLLHEPATLPGRVHTLDELLLVLPRTTPLRFDPTLGFHLYGADLCLQAAQQSLAVVTLDALCLHDSKTMTLPPEYQTSAHLLAKKWPQALPVATSCGWIDHPSP